MSHELTQKALSGTISDEELAAQMERERAELERTWAPPRGLRGWFTDTDHKRIALRYIITAFVFFTFGGIEAALMRIQLARPDSHFLSPDLYNQVFTVHGSTMMFLFAVPIVTALGIYLVPLMVGA
ncbi:MAG TPA: cbb3-type cytochrome c oxidase subunit I, partial [Pyrinomonadaceae bacterium]|nr:cbb3-type cytochrome c oxidase subunit I [Pyrinomonadaceae bacterium]